MLLFLNTYITPEPAGSYLNPNFPLYNRDGNPNPDKLDVLKYMLASYSLIPFDKVILQIELSEDWKKREGELSEWISYCFKSKDYEYTSKRCTNILAWRERLDTVLEPYDAKYPVWFACNHDHIFIDSNINLVSKIDELFQSTQEEYKTLFFTHWSEFMRHAAIYGWKEELDGFISYQPTDLATHSVQIVSASLLREWFKTNINPNDYFPRSDWHRHLDTPSFRIFMPKRELCCHFDGYSHIGVHNQFLTLPEDLSPMLYKGFTKEERESRLFEIFNAFKNQPPCPKEFLDWQVEKGLTL